MADRKPFERFSAAFGGYMGFACAENHGELEALLSVHMMTHAEAVDCYMISLMLRLSGLSAHLGCRMRVPGKLHC